MRVLIVTAMYPSAANQARGTFVKDQVESLREAGLDVDVLPFGPGHDPGYLQAVRLLRSMLRTAHYDVIHAHYGLTGWVARAQWRCPVVITYHGSDLLNEISLYTSEGRKALMAVWASQIIAFFCQRRIIVANVLKPKLRQLDTITIPMGIDITRFTPIPRNDARQQLGLSLDKQYVLFPANPKNRIKRFELAQAAVAVVQESRPAVELLPLVNVPHHQMPLYMNACDALVLTSWHEASPTVIKEAMACNLPLVSVDVGDVAERIDGVGLCYLTEAEPAAIAEKLCHILAQNQRSQARDHMELLSLPNIAQQVIAVYQGVIAS